MPRLIAGVLILSGLLGFVLWLGHAIDKDMTLAETALTVADVAAEEEDWQTVDRNLVAVRTQWDDGLPLLQHTVDFLLWNEAAKNLGRLEAACAARDSKEFSLESQSFHVCLEALREVESWSWKTVV